MSAAIHVFHHHAMATQFQVRIAGEEKTYAAQTAQAAFALMDELESLLSRFRANSDISQIAQLAPGETLRVSEPVFACLEIARKMELATRGAFSVTAAALQSQPSPPRWTLQNFSVRCDCGKPEFDLGAIGKGFALDRMAEVLREWSCPAFLLVAGGSSILAGEAPAGPGRLVMRLGRGQCALPLLAQARLVERVRPGDKRKTHFGSAHRPAGAAAEPRLGIVRHRRRIRRALDGLHGSGRGGDRRDSGRRKILAGLSGGKWQNSAPGEPRVAAARKVKLTHAWF